MTFTVDTNILVRATTLDTPQEGEAAIAFMQSQRMVVPTVVVCEMVWVLRKLYKLDRNEILRAAGSLLDLENVIIDRPAVDAGLAMLEAGGDFADGVIAVEGERLGGKVFATFDRKAARIFAETGRDCRLLSAV
ncbi:MAG: type II toxin-antitoxin system VapC family toxin [Allorhizobium sp.]